MNIQEFHAQMNEIITREEQSFVESFFSSELERQQFFKWAFGDSNALYISLRGKWNDLHGNILFFQDDILDDSGVEPDFRKEFEEMVSLWMAHNAVKRNPQ